MKILLYSFFSGGGIGRYTHCLLTSLAQQSGVSVELACNPEFKHLGEASYATWPKLMPVSSRVPVIRRARFVAAQWVNPGRLLKRAAETSADIVHFSNINHLSYRFWRGSRERAIRHMSATVHDVRRLKAIISRSWEDRWLKQFYRDCDALFTHSQAQKAEIIAFAAIDEDRIHVVPHGIYEYDTPVADVKSLRQKYDIPCDRTVALFFGFIRDDKQLDTLLEAVRQSASRPFLVIAGQISSRSKKTEARYRQAITDLGLSDDVLFAPGFVEDSAVGELFTLADYVCLTYLPEFTSQSGVLHVAAHFACPVLATPTPTVAETVRGDQLGVVAGGFEARDVARAIDLIANHRRDEFRAAHEAYVKRATWESNAITTARVFRELLADPPSTDTDVFLATGATDTG